MANVLISAVHWAVASGRYTADAFRRLGHDVRTCGPAMGNVIWNMQVNEQYAWIPDVALANFVGVDWEVGAVIERLGGWEPDLIVNMDSAFTLAGDKPCPFVLYAVDNHVRTYNRPGEHYDHLFLAHHDGPAKPVCDCYDAPCTWLPCGYDPVWFTPSPIPMADRLYDLALIGYPYPERMALVEAMHAAGLKIFAGLGPLYGEYRDIYHNARISLCKSAAGDVAQRVFETAAMGCIVLTDPCADLDKIGHAPGLPFYVYNNAEEAVLWAKTLTEYPDNEMHKIMDWARPHTWDARAKTILETMKIERK